MLMSELVEALSASFPGVARRDVNRAVRTILDRISHCRMTGERVELRHFGVFEGKTNPPRGSRNPRTGAKIQLGVRHALRFKASSTLIRRMTLRFPLDAVLTTDGAEQRSSMVPASPLSGPPDRPGEPV